MTKKTNTQLASTKKVQKKNNNTKVGIIGLIILLCIGFSFCDDSSTYVCGKDVVCPNSEREHISGQLFRNINTNEIVTGIVKKYYDNGQLHVETKVRNGKAVRGKVYYKNGRLLLDAPSSFGEGKTKAYYENGNLMTEGYFKNGKQEGLWKAYNMNGVLVKEGYFKDGQQIR